MATVIDKLITVLGYEVDDDGLVKAGKRLDRFKGQVDKAAAGIGAVGAGLTAALAVVGRTVLDFERAMNSLQAATNATEEDMGKLRDQARQLGEDTAFSASQAAQAQVEFGKAGLSTVEILEVMPGALALAAAGQLGMAEAAGITVAVLNGFNLETSNAANVSDILAAAASSANTTVSEMGFALSKVAPTAASLGLSVEETAAQLAVLQNNGLQAEVAGTGLRSILLTLANPTTQATKAFREMGVSISDVQRAVEEKRVGEFIQDLGTKNLDAGKAATIFGKEAATQALILAGSSDTLRNLQGAYEGAGGAAQRMADQQLAGLPGVLARLQSKFEAVLLVLGGAGITQALIDAGEAAIGVIDVFLQMDPATQAWLSQLILVGPVLLGIAAALKTVSLAISLMTFLLGINPFVLMVAGAIAFGVVVHNLTKGLLNLIGKLNIIKRVRDFLGFGGGDAPDQIAQATAPAAALLNAAQVTEQNQTNTVTVGEVQVNAQGGDSREIAQNIDRQLRDQLQNTVQDFDGSIVR